MPREPTKYNVLLAAETTYVKLTHYTLSTSSYLPTKLSTLIRPTQQPTITISRMAETTRFNYAVVMPCEGCSKSLTKILGDMKKASKEDGSPALRSCTTYASSLTTFPAQTRNSRTLPSTRKSTVSQSR